MAPRVKLIVVHRALELHLGDVRCLAPVGSSPSPKDDALDPLVLKISVEGEEGSRVAAGVRLRTVGVGLGLKFSACGYPPPKGQISSTSDSGDTSEMVTTRHTNVRIFMLRSVFILQNQSCLNARMRPHQQ
uniref:Uncharacterized protein n=1 Tax=Timema cristinae TaxID=61476 RepID=A0A7R9CBF4_TIMCR|nr:unnamed protein product [Timema cristinae]